MKLKTETVTVSRQAIVDLLKVKEEFDALVESLELMADKAFIASYKKARKQIKNRDFVDWNAL